MRVELLYWPDCPSHERARQVLAATMRSLGLDPTALEVTCIESLAEARAQKFVGSPTIRVDGRDVQPPPPDQDYGLTCRLYRRRDGRPSPLPDPADLSDALAAVASARSDHQEQTP